MNSSSTKIEGTHVVDEPGNYVLVFGKKKIKRKSCQKSSGNRELKKNKNSNNNDNVLRQYIF